MFKINFQIQDNKTNFPQAFIAYKNTMNWGGRPFKLFVKDMRQFLGGNDKSVQFPLR